MATPLLHSGLGPFGSPKTTKSDSEPKEEAKVGSSPLSIAKEIALFLSFSSACSECNDLEADLTIGEEGEVVEVDDDDDDDLLLRPADLIDEVDSVARESKRVENL